MKKSIVESQVNKASFFAPKNFEKYMRKYKGAEEVHSTRINVYPNPSLDSSIYNLSDEGVTLLYTLRYVPGIFHSSTIILAGRRDKVNKIEKKILEDAGNFRKKRK